ncbi:MAG: hypothetical protein NVS1B7_5150 [Candidatus Saccharimonadales bacterium]
MTTTSHHFDVKRRAPKHSPLKLGVSTAERRRYQKARPFSFLTAWWPVMVRRVMGHSMVPVLPPKTKVYAWRWFHRLKPGDIIIFKREGRETIKRLERYELDRLFVLGDHVQTSTDSRHFGAIARHDVQAKVVWPRAKKQLI